LLVEKWGPKRKTLSASWSVGSRKHQGRRHKSYAKDHGDLCTGAAFTLWKRMANDA